MAELTTPQRIRQAADKIAGAILLDPASESRHVQAVRNVFKDVNADRLVDRAARSLIAVYGEEKLADDAFLAEVTKATMARLFIPDPAPTAGDIVRVLGHLAKAGRGADTVDALIVAFTPKDDLVEDPAR